MSSRKIHNTRSRRKKNTKHRLNITRVSTNRDDPTSSDDSDSANSSDYVQTISNKPLPKKYGPLIKKGNKKPLKSVTNKKNKNTKRNDEKSKKPLFETKQNVTTKKSTKSVLKYRDAEKKNAYLADEDEETEDEENENSEFDLFDEIDVEQTKSVSNVNRAKKAITQKPSKLDALVLSKPAEIQNAVNRKTASKATHPTASSVHSGKNEPEKSDSTKSRKRKLQFESDKNPSPPKKAKSEPPPKNSVEPDRNPTHPISNSNADGNGPITIHVNGNDHENRMESAFSRILENVNAENAQIVVNFHYHKYVNSDPHLEN